MWTFSINLWGQRSLILVKKVCWLTSYASNQTFLMEFRLGFTNSSKPQFFLYGPSSVQWGHTDGGTISAISLNCSGNCRNKIIKSLRHTLFFQMIKEGNVKMTVVLTNLSILNHLSLFPNPLNFAVWNKSQTLDPHPSHPATSPLKI